MVRSNHYGHFDFWESSFLNQLFSYLHTFTYIFNHLVIETGDVRNFFMTFEALNSKASCILQLSNGIEKLV